jgi:uncharacterized protein (TIGR00251 family)
VPTVRRDGTDLVIALRVQPRAGRAGFAGVHGDRLRVRLAAPPVDGRANAELVEFLADAFGVSRAHVAIEQGMSGRDKRVRVRDPATVPDPIAALLGRG